MSQALDYAARVFDFGDSTPEEEFNDNSNAYKKEELLDYIRSQIIGEGKKFQTPFGYRKMTYCDYTASGKSLQYIENYLQEHVLPFYGNTHTTTSITGRQSTFFRHESRELIKHELHGTEEDILLFTGTGATGAIHKMIGCLGLDQVSKSDLVVFIGPYEHHSNLLPWRELNCKTIVIPEDKTGSIDMKFLEHQLQTNIHYSIKIGVFSAASNVTGVLTNQNKITACLHRYEALAFWDFAAAGPYITIDMNPIIEGLDRHLVYKDAIFISPHKFLGGPNTPGILLAKRKLFQRPTPTECGGGTVFFVSREDHRYLSSIEEREEGGTPDIIGSIRCGLVFQLKQQLTSEFIHSREIEFIQKAREKLSQNHNFIIIGPSSLPQIPIFSFLIKHENSNLFLHHNFICAVLNDIYGIQVRGGCVCAGPYAQELLGIDFNLSKKFESLLLKFSCNDNNLSKVLPRERDRIGAGTELIRPGFVRLNFHYTMSDESFNYVLNALEQISLFAWKILPLYKFNQDTGEWIHSSWSLQRDRRWLGSLGFFNPENSKVEFHVPKRQHQTRSMGQIQEINNLKQLPDNLNDYYKLCLSEAQNIYENPKKYLKSIPRENEMTLFKGTDVEALRWFLLPYEAYEFLQGNGIKREAPFIIKNYEQKQKKSKTTQNLQEQTKEEQTTQEEEDNTVANTGEQTGEPDSNFLDSFEFNDEDDDDGDDDVKPVSSKSGFKFHVPSKKIIRNGLNAIEVYDMIHHGDRIIACISGGKDSLSMLHLLKHFQFIQKSKGIEFDLAAATVDPQTHSTFDPRPLKIYMEALGIPYFYLSEPIMDRAKNAEECKSICSYCSRMKRGMLYTCARKEGYNVLALGQHLDDLAESFMMSLFHNGLLRTMKANYSNTENDLRIIRPLVHTRERDLAKFASEKKLPVIPENCPACFEAPKERHRLKQLLAAQETLHKNVFKSMKEAIRVSLNLFFRFLVI